MSEKFVGTRPVAHRHLFDVGRLEEWWTEAIGPLPGPLAVSQFKGGQSNPSYLLRSGKEGYVLRRKPPGKLLPSAHAVDREYRVISALAKTDVPVPPALALCEDDSVIGTAFFVMGYGEGRVLWDPGRCQAWTMPNARGSTMKSIVSESAPPKRRPL